MLKKYSAFCLTVYVFSLNDFVTSLNSRLERIIIYSRFSISTAITLLGHHSSLNSFHFFLSPLNIPTTHAFVRLSRPWSRTLSFVFGERTVGISIAHKACRRLPFVVTLLMFCRSLVNSLCGILCTDETVGKFFAVECRYISLWMIIIT